MATSPRGADRVFKTAWFARAARKADITDAELCTAVAQVMAGQCDDLGGGVFKKRLSKNLYRSIVLARGGRLWVYAYVFAKQDRANIGDAELREFRRLAEAYATLTAPQLARLLDDRDLTEICHGDQAQVQE